MNNDTSTHCFGTHYGTSHIEIICKVQICVSEIIISPLKKTFLLDTDKDTHYSVVIIFALPVGEN